MRRPGPFRPAAPLLIGIFGICAAACGGTKPAGTGGTSSPSNTGGQPGSGGGTGTGGHAGSGGAGTGGGAVSTGGAGGAGQGRGGSGGGGGGDVTTGISYSGCSFGGDISRVAVSKRDTQRDLCVLLVLSMDSDNPWGLTLPQFWGVQSASRRLGTPNCLGRVSPADAVPAIGGTGSVTFVQGTGRVDLDVNVVLTFASGAGGAPAIEELMVQSLDIASACPL